MLCSQQLDLLAIAASLLLLVGACVAAIYHLSTAIISLYFSPLSPYPGPKTWAVSRIPYAYNLYRGNLAHRVKQLHERYGPIVRLSPDELSFVHAGAWEDIYGHRLGNPAFPKDPLWHRPQVNGVRSILSANDADHARIRRLLVHGFSDKALREQEPLIQSYVNLFMTRLLEQTSNAEEGTAIVNIAQWFNFITFDVIGDLSFGESFHCLEMSHYHPWIAILFSHFKALALSVCCRFFPVLERMMLYTLPKRVKQQRIDHFNMSKNKVHQRIEAQRKLTGRNVDFMDYVLRHNDEKGMSLPEIEATFNILVVAGSETTATTLAGIMNYLLKDVAILESLVREIRGSFASASEITAERVSKLAYLNMVIEEGLRLCQPVPLGSPRRVPLGGAIVCGHWLPENTSVSIPQYAISLSALHYSNPTSFLPSRWLPASSSPPSSSPSSPSTANPTANPSAFHPFSLGNRRCIGQSLAYLEMRLVLSRLLWTFDVELKGQPWAWEEQKTWILWEKRGLEVRIKEREGAVLQ